MIESDEVITIEATSETTDSGECGEYGAGGFSALRAVAFAVVVALAVFVGCTFLGGLADGPNGNVSSVPSPVFAYDEPRGTSVYCFCTATEAASVAKAIPARLNGGVVVIGAAYREADHSSYFSRAVHWSPTYRLGYWLTVPR